MGVLLKNLPETNSLTENDVFILETSNGTRKMSALELRENVVTPQIPLDYAKGTANSPQVLSGYTFSNDKKLNIVGSMPNRGNQSNWEPTGSTSKTYNEGYYPSDFTASTAKAYASGETNGKDHYKSSVISALNTAGVSTSSSASWDTILSNIRSMATTEVWQYFMSISATAANSYVTWTPPSNYTDCFFNMSYSGSGFNVYTGTKVNSGNVYITSYIIYSHNSATYTIQIGRSSSSYSTYTVGANSSCRGNLGKKTRLSDLYFRFQSSVKNYALGVILYGYI